MQEIFHLDERITNCSIHLVDWPLSQVLLKNDANFPWLLLVPKRNNVQEIYQLSEIDSRQLMQEIRDLSLIVKQAFAADKINVAAFGNIVPQLHVHVIARYTSDAKWPQPVWGLAEQLYTNDELNAFLTKLNEYLK